MDQGVAVGIFPAQNSTLLFIKKFLRFYHFLFVFVILLSNMSLPSIFFSGKKVLAPSIFFCEKILARIFFRGKSPCPVLVTATPCYNKFCVVPLGPSALRRTTLMDSS